MERFFIFAKPKIIDVSRNNVFIFPPYSSLSAINDLNITITGNSFYNPRNVYLSGQNPNMFVNTTYYNPFSAIKNLSGSNPGFNALVVPSFNLITDKYITFTLPEYPLSNGFVDIIVENEAGYGLLTQGSITNYPSSWSGFVNSQSPSISGIQIIYI